MKKLSLLIALALLITVGGVYATWSYSESTATASSTLNPSVRLMSTHYTEKGSILFAGAPSIAFDDLNNDHVADLNWIDTNNMDTRTLKVVFNPNSDATDKQIDIIVSVVLPLDIKTNEISTFKGKAVFKPFDENYIKENATFEATVSKNIITITLLNVGSGGVELDLSEYITTDLELPTLDDYNNFASVMANYPINISAAEALAN
ncbi:MAG: hypothetical protein IJX13_05640 [Clostridia bacterium]|nr:hypothetical protein [Clostridia bacterium]